MVSIGKGFSNATFKVGTNRPRFASKSIFLKSVSSMENLYSFSE